MTHRPAGACRSGSPAPCWSATCRRRAVTNCSAAAAAWPPGCGRRRARPGAFPGVWRSRAAGRSAAASPTPTCCSPAACWRTSPAVVALPTEQLQILDTWHTLGLRGTGSHDSVADEVFVPDERVLSIFDGPVIDRPLYRFPPFGFFASCITAAAMGNARAAIDNFIDLAGTKKGAAAQPDDGQRSTIQVAVATAESALEAARAGYYQAIDEAWQARPKTGPEVSLAARTRLRLAATHGARISADVVRSMYDFAGGSAIYDGAPLQRRLRDAFTASAHFQVNEASSELPGRILLGQARRGGDAVRSPIEAVLPFWLDRPDLEAIEVAEAVNPRASVGCGSAKWRRSMRSRWPPRSVSARRVSGCGSDRCRSVCGRRPQSRWVPVRLPRSPAPRSTSPWALPARSSSSGWYDRDWSHSVARMRETIECLRPILRGERGDFDGHSGPQSRIPSAEPVAGQLGSALAPSAHR